MRPKHFPAVEAGMRCRGETQEPELRGRGSLAARGTAARAGLEAAGEAGKAGEEMDEATGVSSQGDVAGRAARRRRPAMGGVAAGADGEAAADVDCEAAGRGLRAI